MPGEQYFPTRSIPLVHDLKPKYYDGYSGENSIPARVSYLPVSYEHEGTQQKAVVRLADLWINPFTRLKQEVHMDTETSQPKTVMVSETTGLVGNPNLKAATIIYIGGGDSDALASTGLAGYIRDAQKASLEGDTDAKWYARNIVTVSHPAGAPHTEQAVAATSMRLSAEIVHKAIQQAIADGSINAENIILMGSSAGGAMATELAAIMGDQCKQLILEEPAAMGRHRNIRINFLLSGFRGAYRDARRHGMNRRDALRFARDDTRLSWTLPEGAPANWRELWRSLSHHESSYANLGSLFGLSPNITSHNLSPSTLGRDTTTEARELITCPVALVESTESKVVNLFRARGKFKRRELRQITRGSRPAKAEAKATAMMEDLFPHASTRFVAMVPGYAHSGLGRNQGVWQQLLTEVQQIPLAA